MTEFDRIAADYSAGKPLPSKAREQRYVHIFTSAFEYMMTKPANAPDDDDALSVAIFKACKEDKQETIFGVQPDIDRLKRIFKVCYSLLDMYKEGVPDAAWRGGIYGYWKSKLDETDMLGVRMMTACIEELQKQSGLRA